MEEIRNIFG